MPTDDPTYEPTEDPTDDTARVARAYYDAWTNRKGPDALRELMGEAFVFDSAMVHIQGREQFSLGPVPTAGPSVQSRLCSLRRMTASMPSSSIPGATAA
jgi:hypothetical protein